MAALLCLLLLLLTASDQNSVGGDLSPRALKLLQGHSKPNLE